MVWLLVSDHPSVPAEASQLFGTVDGVSRDGRRYARRLLVSGSGDGASGRGEIGGGSGVGGTGASGLHTGPDLFAKAKSVASGEERIGGEMPVGDAADYPSYKLALREAWSDWLLMSECDFVVAVAGEKLGIYAPGLPYCCCQGFANVKPNVKLTRHELAHPTTHTQGQWCQGPLHSPGPRLNAGCV